MSLTEREIKRGYHAIRRKAWNIYRKGEYLDTVYYLNACALLASQFNFIYSDNELESMFKGIAENCIRRCSGYEADPDRWILYDEFCTTYVLGVQWLEAMVKSGKKILYITTRDIEKESRHRNIIDIVEGYGNVDIEVIPQGNILERAQALYDMIIQSRASKIVLHKQPVSSLMGLVLPILPDELKSYVINLSDQTFWLGADAVDYCLEFRQFGASVSLQRRGLSRQQLLMVPFYPADDANEFAGFPPECTGDKVIIFSGGDYYKTLDEERMYWKLVRDILKKYPQVVFLFATKNIPEGDAGIRRFIEENHFEHRFIYIGFRPDVYQVFAHCDIYMGTSPTSGSLMSQLAAINAKPILQYYVPDTPDDETEQAICINDDFRISFQDETGFMNEADRLISDQSYRIGQGERLKNAMMQKDQFNDLVTRTLNSNETQMPVCDYSIDYKSLDDRWYYMEKAGYTDALQLICGKLGTKAGLRYAPMLLLKYKWRRIKNLFRC